MPKLEPALLPLLLESQHSEEITKTEGNRQNEVTLVTNDAVIFYPSSDIPVNEKTSFGSGKPGNYITLEDTLHIASNTSAYFNKTLYIPITEERNRKHFVLLVIDANRGSATLYDSKNAPNCFLRFCCCRSTYPTGPIVAQVLNAFPHIEQEDFQKIHLGSQSVMDDHSCGYQVVAMMLALIEGKTLQADIIASKVSELKKITIQVEEEEQGEVDIISVASLTS